MLCISDSFTRGEVLPKVYFVIHLRTVYDCVFII